MADVIDHHDFGKLLAAIVRQALDDYIKLQHPKYRKKKYLIEAYDNAVDMFFDDDYRFSAIQNEDGDDMSLRDMVQTALKSDRVEIQKIRDHAIDQAVAFWDKKEIRTVEIPESLQVNGHVYRVQHQPDPGYKVNYEAKTLFLDKHSGSTQEECFVAATFEIMLHHEDIVLKKNDVKHISKAWFRMLKINNCFTGVD